MIITDQNMQHELTELIKFVVVDGIHFSFFNVMKHNRMNSTNKKF